MLFRSESFSSVGGMMVGGTFRNKPDFTAPDGVSTTVVKFPLFYGTSAAAPHAAAVAGLLQSAYKKYFNGKLIPDSVRSILMRTSLDIGSSGFDNISGSGLIQADAALMTFASPAPVITVLTPDDPNILPGTQPMTVTVTGTYLNSNTTMYVRGVPVPTTYVDANHLEADIPEIGRAHV